jgi:CubicO group peptidase (beta-lactamase class C family)
MTDAENAENAENVADSMRLDEALRQMPGVRIDAATIRAHVMRPAHVLGVTSDRGIEVEPAPTPAGLAAGEQPEEFLGYQFNPDGFVSALQAAFDNSVAGYAMGLNRSGLTMRRLAWGWAHEPWDTAEAWTPDVRQHVASLSKQPTAMAMVRALNEAGLTPDTPIIGYLPDYWGKGPNVDQITFANLMTHTSGLAYGIDTSEMDFEFMKAQIAAGTTDLGQFWYQNMNFGLCRILIPTVAGNISPDTLVPPSIIDTYWDAITLNAYQKYVQANVFAPSGVTDATFVHEPDDALAYNFPVSGTGWNSGDLTTLIGWHMTVDDVLKVMGTFRRAGTIVSPEQAQTMLDSRFAIDTTAKTQLGTLYAKNGGFQDSVGQVEQGVLFYLPEDMELVVLVNSPIGSPAQSLFEAVYEAFGHNIVARLPPPRGSR